MTPRTSYWLWSAVVMAAVVVVSVDGGGGGHLGHPQDTPLLKPLDTSLLKVKREAPAESKQAADIKPQVTSQVATVKPAVTATIAGKKNESKQVTSKAGSSEDQAGDSRTKQDTDDEEDSSEHKGPKGLSSDAVLRGFYVFIGVGTLVLLYIAIKFVRLRRRPSTQKYRVLSTTNDQEMLPLAADDGEDEEIYNAADHQHSIK